MDARAPSQTLIDTLQTLQRMTSATRPCYHFSYSRRLFKGSLRRKWEILIRERERDLEWNPVLKKNNIVFLKATEADSWGIYYCREFMKLNTWQLCEMGWI